MTYEKTFGVTKLSSGKKGDFIMKLKEYQKIYVRSMSKTLLVTALFTDDDKANKYMKTHPNEGVIAEYDNVIFIANLYDNGNHQI